MIYTKEIMFLKKKYQELKKAKKLCIEDSSSNPDHCRMYYYQELIKLIELNKQFLKDVGKLNKEREKVLNEHIKKAKEHYEHYKKKVKENATNY